MPPSQGRDPHRLLPVDPSTRALASDLYARVAHAPIISPHGHVPPSLLLDDQPFANPADLFVTHDHYVTRLLHAAGVGLEELSADAEPREVWHLLAERWHLFAGTASGYWIEEELSEVLGVDLPLTVDSYDAIEAKLAQAEFRPRALFDRFGIEFLATTDDPLDELAAHEALQAEGLRVAPTFRPDRYADPEAAGFVEAVARLGVTSFDSYLTALEARREYFIRHGAVSADHGVVEPYTLDLDAADAERLFQRVVAGEGTKEERRAFRGHMLLQFARMSVDDGLVMTIHAGVFRNHSTATFDRFGPDTGHDLPVSTSFVHGMRPLLERFGLERDLHIVLFTVDETAYSREIAPMASFYPCLYVGAPWWFLDAPDAMARVRSAVTETAGFYRGSGFVDDTRAFLSIPARHDTARRADAGYLARLVREGRLNQKTAEQIIDDLVGDIPRTVFAL